MLRGRGTCMTRQPSLRNAVTLRRQALRVCFTINRPVPGPARAHRQLNKRLFAISCRLARRKQQYRARSYPQRSRSCPHVARRRRRSAPKNFNLHRPHDLKHRLKSETPKNPLNHARRPPPYGYPDPGFDVGEIASGSSPNGSGSKKSETSYKILQALENIPKTAPRPPLQSIVRPVRLA